MTENATPAGPTSAPPIPGPAPDAAPPGPAPKRARGRPFGSTTRKPPLTETPVTDAGAALPAGQEAEEPQRRRRRNKAVDKEALTKQLVGLHAMAAHLTGLELIAIGPSEAAMLADAIESMSREYDLALDGKTGAFIQLIAAAAVVYGPRVLKFRALKKRALAEQEAAITAAETARAAAANGAVTGH